ncbi:MAG TPA: DUF5719 family protein [Acidimicrobiales bacterium]|nr:DUF5719 family protein [Acidimicrobiales bacterium]
MLAVLTAGLVVGGLIDRAGAPHTPASVTAEAVQPVPVAAPARAYSSSWFCAGATNAAPNDAAGTVRLANAGERAVTGRVAVVTSSGGGRAVTVTVAPHATVDVPETVKGGGPWAGAIVDVDGGSLAVSQIVDGPLGRATTPCATSGSQHWYLPGGQSRINAAETILLLNPYPTHSIVDMAFTTDQGVENPQEFQGLDVPPGGLLAVPLGSHLRRRASIATTVSARTGNVVAWETEVVTPPPAGAPLVGTPAANQPFADPAFPVPGVTLTLGAPSAGNTWVWPEGLAGGGIDEQYLIYNPGPQTAEVSLSVGLQHGTAEPFSLTVGPYQVVNLVSERQARIPAGLPHTATLVSVNGVPVVAARSVSAAKATVGPGATRNGLGLMLGERVTAPEWVVPATLVDSAHQADVVILNPGTVPVQVREQDLATGGGSQATVPAGGRLAAPVPAGMNSVLVTATGPVYVESDVYGVGKAAGYSITSAVPLS